MDKIDFLSALENKLTGFPEDDITRSIDYYSEIIDDMTEDGINEEDAVATLGSLDDIVKQIVAEIPFTKLVKEKIKTRKKRSALNIILLLIGSPLWLSLLLAAFAVVLSLYAAIWSVIISLWAVFASLVGVSVGVTAARIVFLAIGNPPLGLVALGAGIFCAGLSIFMFFGCRETTRGLLFLTRKSAIGIKHLFVKKEEAK